MSKPKSGYYGLNSVVSESRDLRGYYDAYYLELFVCLSDRRVWTVPQVSLGHNTWTVYDDRDVVKVCDLCCPVTRARLVELIDAAVSRCVL